jgi:hypothetical protein
LQQDLKASGKNGVLHPRWGGRSDAKENTGGCTFAASLKWAKRNSQDLKQLESFLQLWVMYIPKETEKLVFNNWKKKNIPYRESEILPLSLKC